MITKKPDIKVILTIILLSSLTGVSYNYFSSRGIPLLKPEKTALGWAEDSLISSIPMPQVEMSRETSDSAKTVNNDSITRKVKPVIPGTEKAANGTGVKLPADSNEAPKGFSAPELITINQAYKLYKSNSALFIDARDKWDFSEGHIEGAINIPHYNFEKTNPVLKTIPKQKLIVAYCGGEDCEASRHLADELFSLGYKRIYVFFGGWNEWTKAGYETQAGGN